MYKPEVIYIIDSKAFSLGDPEEQSTIPFSGSALGVRGCAHTEAEAVSASWFSSPSSCHPPPPWQTDMRLFLLLVVTLLSVAPVVVNGGDKKKLQIGIKKRVDNCPIKSRKGDVLNMHYTGKLEDGTEFDSSIPRNQPFTFTLGTGQVIKGWDQGLLGMCEGEKRKLVIPSELGYGDRGAPPKIPGGATLIFEVELLSIERRSDL
ncbi:peptidyl-prolyl cis-trans isomerase FKBP2-like isoform X2 [Arapaima gigas]